MIATLDCEPFTFQEPRDGANTVREYFRTRNYGHLSPLVHSLVEGTLTLKGTVPSYHTKQIAQSLAQQVAGVRVVRNLLDVEYPVHEMRYW